MNFIGMLFIICAIYIAYSILRNKKNAKEVGDQNLASSNLSSPRKMYRIFIEIILLIFVLWLYLRLMYENI